MAFSINDIHLPDVGSYDEALSVWQMQEGERWASKQTEGWPEDERPLAIHRKGYMGIFKHTDGDIDFRYHDTVCVRWHPNNTATIDMSYQSVSTNKFINAFCPTGVMVRCTPSDWYSDSMVALVTGWRLTSDRWRGSFCVNTCNVYRTGDVMTVATGAKLECEIADVLRYGSCWAGRIVSGGTRPFQSEAIDRKRTRELLAATRYDEFRDWLQAWFALTGGRQVSAFEFLRRQQRVMHTDEILAALADRDQWSVLRNIAYAEAGILKGVRDAIYAGHRVHITTQHDHASSFEQAAKWLRDENR